MFTVDFTVVTRLRIQKNTNIPIRRYLGSPAEIVKGVSVNNTDSVMV